MSSNLNIFEQTACLSDEQLLLYVSGKMNAEEKRKAELHLADCDMCADAVEGLQLTHNKNIAAINEKLHSAIDMRLSKTATIIPFYRKYLTTIIDFIMSDSIIIE